MKITLNFLSNKRDLLRNIIQKKLIFFFLLFIFIFFVFFIFFRFFKIAGGPLKFQRITALKNFEDFDLSFIDGSYNKESLLSCFSENVVTRNFFFFFFSDILSVTSLFKNPSEMALCQVGQLFELLFWYKKAVEFLNENQTTFSRERNFTMIFIVAIDSNCLDFFNYGTTSIDHANSFIVRAIGNSFEVYYFEPELKLIEKTIKENLISFENRILKEQKKWWNLKNVQKIKKMQYTLEQHIPKINNLFEQYYKTINDVAYKIIIEILINFVLKNQYKFKLDDDEKIINNDGKIIIVDIEKTLKKIYDYGCSKDFVNFFLEQNSVKYYKKKYYSKEKIIERKNNILKAFSLFDENKNFYWDKLHNLKYMVRIFCEIVAEVEINFSYIIEVEIMKFEVNLWSRTKTLNKKRDYHLLLNSELAFKIIQNVLNLNEETFIHNKKRYQTGGDCLIDAIFSLEKLSKLFLERDKENNPLSLKQIDERFEKEYGLSPEQKKKARKMLDDSFFNYIIVFTHA